jgi:hypothetical protein
VKRMEKKHFKLCVIFLFILYVHQFNFFDGEDHGSRSKRRGRRKQADIRKICCLLNETTEKSKHQTCI